MNTLRLSDAIRLGSLLRPQAFGFYHFGGGFRYHDIIKLRLERAQAKLKQKAEAAS